MNFLSEAFKGFLPSQEGFVFMWAIIVVALIAFIIIIERWIEYRRRTNVDEPLFVKEITKLLLEQKLEDAYKLCMAGGKRALPSIIGAGIKMKTQSPQLARSAMEGEFLKIIPSMDKRVNLILTFGNISTMLGLMGTIYGLILSFSAVSEPGVSAVEKSALLASGISTAMNTTLWGLVISIPCVMIFSVFRARIDMAVKDLDRYALAILRYLVRDHAPDRDYRFSSKRIKEEIDTEPNIGPMMSLIVILIPLLLSSAEFVKIGAIELNLPSASEEERMAEKKPEEDKESLMLNLQVEVKKDGFNLLHYFRKEEKKGEKSNALDIPLKEGEYDYETLKEQLAHIKRLVLFEIVKNKRPGIQKESSLVHLFTWHYSQKNRYAGMKNFMDYETVQIIAGDDINYQTLVSTMDSSREIRQENVRIRMFPNVALAGGPEA